MVLLLLVLLEEVLNHVLLLLHLVRLDGEVDGLGVDQGELVVEAGLVIANDLKVEDKLQKVANEIKKNRKNRNTSGWNTCLPSPRLFSLSNTVATDPPSSFLTKGAVTLKI